MIAGALIGGTLAYGLGASTVEPALAGAAPASPTASLPFDAARPTRLLWVSPGGSAKGDGTRERPFASIGAAVALATPGTAVLVRAGVYYENVVIPRSVSGTRAAPIWLVSADGAQRARIIAPRNDKPAIVGGGSEYVAVEGFRITGGKNGIQFSQNGFDFTDMIRNIRVRYNLIETVVEDGIKANGGDYVEVTHNIVRGANDEGIDFVSILHGTIANNEVAEVRTPSAGLFAKQGSRDILIAANHIHDITADGLSVGGWSNPLRPPRPGHAGFEAKDVTVVNNRVERVGKRAIAFLGALDSSARGNFLSTTVVDASNVHVGRNALTALIPIGSRNIAITDNVLNRTRKQIDICLICANVLFVRNRASQSWGGVVGPDMSGYRLPQGVIVG